MLGSRVRAVTIVNLLVERQLPEVNAREERRHQVAQRGPRSPHDSSPILEVRVLYMLHEFIAPEERALPTRGSVVSCAACNEGYHPVATFEEMRNKSEERVAQDEEEQRGETRTPDEVW